jgi:hypothetical protein
VLFLSLLKNGKNSTVVVFQICLLSTGVAFNGEELDASDTSTN